MAVKKKDFVEIEFVARVKGGEIFDTNIPSEVKKAQLEIKEVKPYVLSVGQEMIIKGLDNDLEGKEVGKEYTVEIKPEEAYGKRNPQLVKMIPMAAFKEHNIMPQRGMQFNIDNQAVKVVSVSGGRVLTDFNNPLAGKNVVYEYKILREVKDQKEQINAVQEFMFRKKFPFTVKEKEIIFEVDQEGMDKYIEMVSKAFEDILGMTAKGKFVAPKGEKKEEKSKEDSSESKAE